MVSDTRFSPGFGEADLSNCERERIHQAGSIQPHGALLVIRESDLKVIQASANASQFLNLPAGVLQRSLADLDSGLAEALKPCLERPLHKIPVAVRCRLGSPEIEFDAIVHRTLDSGLVIELERADPDPDLSTTIVDALQGILRTPSLRALCDDTAGLFRRFIGYDRVMVYRFDEDGHGEILSEEKQTELESFLGNRYPASDIPQIARRLYERNRVRVLVDVDYTPVPLEPRISPLSRQELDMSLCFLRSMSPIHIQYLKNMGVSATLVASLVVGGRLWGLIACHHYSPRQISCQMRAVCELLAEAVATRIAALESFAQSQAELTVRRLERRMLETLSQDGDWRKALFEQPQSLLQPVDATGAVLLLENEIMTSGEVPDSGQIRDIRKWLDSHPRASVYATASLVNEKPEFAQLTPVASGLLATPLSDSQGEYLIWFRPEQVRTVTWGGNPSKPFVIGDNPADLSPRRSFAKWLQEVKGTAEPWTAVEVTTARMIGHSVADVIRQFRAVRMLLARDQLEQVSRQVHFSEQPTIVADQAGRILLHNESFERLLMAARGKILWLDDLPPYFSDSADVHKSVNKLLRQGQPWREELTLIGTITGLNKPLLVRGDPVFSSPDHLLGFVLFFTDLSEQKAAAQARLKLQESINEQQQLMNLLLDSDADPMFRNILASILSNAELAGLEITDGMEPSRVPEALEGVRVSVARTAELLDHLVGHSTKSREPKP